MVAGRYTRPDLRPRGHGILGDKEGGEVLLLGSGRRRGCRAFTASIVLLWLSNASLAAPPGDTRTHLPDHRLGPLQAGRTTEKEAVERLGKGLRFPTALGAARCWSEASLMLCAAFEKGTLTTVSIEEHGPLPSGANRFLRGPDGKKPRPSEDTLRAILKPDLFLSSLATETGLRIDRTERELLAALGSPHELRGSRALFRFTYRSSKDKDPACPGECVAVYTLSKERIVSIQITSR